MPSNILDLVHSKKHTLSELIDYSTDAIVSKTIAKNNGGSAVIFAFYAGQGLSEHTSPVDALVYIVEGEGEISISGDINRLKQGELIVMPANEPHSVKALQNMKMMLVMLKILE